MYNAKGKAGYKCDGNFRTIVKYIVKKLVLHILNYEVISLQEKNKKKLKELQEQKFHNKFNSVTEKLVPENQNQEHNVRKEGITPINQKC